MRTVFPFFAMGPVPILASSIITPLAVVCLASVDFSSGVMPAFFFSFLSFFFSFFSPSSLPSSLASSFPPSFFLSASTATGFPSSAFRFLLFLSLFEGASTTSDSRGRFCAFFDSSSLTSSNRLYILVESQFDESNIRTHLASLSTSARSSGCISTSELTSRRS